MKPILFNTEMVQAILDDRKTVTRRVIKNKDIINGFDLEVDGRPIAYIDQATGNSYKPNEIAPYRVGDILYVRETWTKAPFKCWDAPHVRSKSDPYCAYYFKAGWDRCSPSRWYTSLHMPKEAARIFLRVTDVRVERLQDITVEGIKKEGCNQAEIDSYIRQLAFSDQENIEVAHRISFSQLWDSTVSKKDSSEYGYSANPWVWVIEFERCEKPEEK